MKIYFVGEEGVENFERSEISIRTNGQVFHIAEVEEGLLVTALRTQNIKIEAESNVSVVLQAEKNEPIKSEQGINLSGMSNSQEITGK